MKPGAIGLLLATFCCFGAKVSAVPRKWAVLVASTKGWRNYRHQSDVCRAYQILRANDFPASQIITMMYDDIAHHTSNPFPGQVFNDYSLDDNYNGVKIDYKGTDVSPDMLVRILVGDSDLRSQGKKVMESGPEDDVFIYFSGHGGEMSLLFAEDVLYADVFYAALDHMHECGMYKNMVIYFEACYGGSIFKYLLTSDMRIYVMTAADVNERSFAAFCGLQHFETCLGNVFSHTWMRHIDQANPATYSLDDLYMATKNDVTRSNVSFYGDETFKDRPVGHFIGIRQAKHRQKRSTPDDLSDKYEVADVISSDQAHLVPLYTKLSCASVRTPATCLAELNLDFKQKRKELVKETVEYIEKYVQSKILPSYEERTALDTAKCFRQMHESFSKRCFPAYSTTEAISYYHNFLSMCESGYDPRVAVEAIEDVCN